MIVTGVGQIFSLVIQSLKKVNHKSKFVKIFGFLNSKFEKSQLLVKI